MKHASLLFIFFVCPPVWGQTPIYRLELKVEEPYQKLLQQNLTLAKHLKNKDISLERFKLFYNATPEQIKTLLATEGFYSPKIYSSLEKNNQTWVARFEINLGPVTYVASANLEFTGDITSQNTQATISQLRIKWPLTSGTVFRQPTWEQAKQALLSALLTQRYPEARITHSQALVDPDAATATLQVTIDSGPPFFFGHLSITGLQRYPASVIENLNPLHYEEDYSQERLIEFQTRLQNTPYFNNVLVTANLDQNTSSNANMAQEKRTVPINVTVTENQEHKLDFGIGISTNSGVRGQINYSDINIRNRAWRLTTGIKVDRKEQSLRGELALPTSRNGYNDSIGAGLSHSDIGNLITRSFNVSLKHAKTEGKIERAATVLYEASREEIKNDSEQIKRALAPGYAWTYRDFDDLLNPHRGYELALQVSGATKALLSTQNFARLYSKWLGVISINAKNVFLFRAEAGRVFAPSREGIPNVFLFRAGGDQSLRGYAYQSIGVEENGAIVGGRYLAIAGVEYIHWIRPRWGAAVFYESGDAFDNLKDFNAATGYGVGARWRSPVGPLNFDIAYGERVKEMRLHLSLGLVF